MDEASNLDVIDEECDFASEAGTGVDAADRRSDLDDAFDARPVLALALLILVPATLIASIAFAGVRVAAFANADDALARGLAAHASGDLARAQREYLSVLEADPQNKFAFYNLGLVAHARDDLATAELNYRAAIGIDQSFIPAIFNLAIVRAHRGASAEAVGLYRRVISLDRTHAGAYMNLGVLLRSLGDEAGAVAAIERARALSPSIVPARPAPVATK